LGILFYGFQVVVDGELEIRGTELVVMELSAQEVLVGQGVRGAPVQHLRALAFVQMYAQGADNVGNELILDTEQVSRRQVELVGILVHPITGADKAYCHPQAILGNLDTALKEVVSPQCACPQEIAISGT